MLEKVYFYSCFTRASITLCYVRKVFIQFPVLNQILPLYKVGEQKSRKIFNLDFVCVLKQNAKWLQMIRLYGLIHICSYMHAWFIEILLMSCAMLVYKLVYVLQNYLLLFFTPVRHCCGVLCVVHVMKNSPYALCAFQVLENYSNIKLCSYVTSVAFVSIYIFKIVL